MIMVLCPEGINSPITFLLTNTSVQRCPMLYPSLRPMVSLLQEENCCILENLGEILNGTAGVEPKVFCWFTLTQHNLDPSVQNFGLCQWDKWYKIAILFGKMLDVFALAMS